MKAAIITFLTISCFSSYASGYTDKKGYIGWQLPSQSGDISLKAWFSTWSNNDCIEEGVQVLPAIAETRLIAEPGQSILICAKTVLLDKNPFAVIMGTTRTDDTEPIYHIRMVSHEAQLTLTHPYQCPASPQQSYPYSAASPFLSEHPFLVSFVKNPSKGTARSTEGKLPLIPANPSPPTAEALSSYGGGYFFNDYRDDYFRRRPRGGYLVSGQSSTLTLLPLVRSGHWQQILPMSQWWHWLFGRRDEKAGITLSVRFNHSPPAYLQLSQAEFHALSEFLHDTRQVLQYLAPRFSGRQAFIEHLLTLHSSTPALSWQTRQTIKRQVTALLEWPDNEFNLDFEISQLSQAMNASVSPEWIRQLPGKREKEQKVTGLSGEKSSGATKKTSTGQGGAGQQEDQGSGNCNNTGQPSGAKASVAQPNQAHQHGMLTITLLGRFDAGKSSLANCLLGIEHFEVNAIRTKNDEPDAVVQPEKSVPERTVRVRSLPGYGSEEIEEWLAKHRIDPSEVLVFVSSESMDEDDFEVLTSLIDKGHPVSRMVFVRNKFDSVLSAELEQQHQQDNPDAIQRISASLQDQLRGEFQEDLQEWLRHVRQDLTQVNLHFTSCASLFSCKGIEAVLNAIESQLRDADERMSFRDFSNIRKTVPEWLSLYTGWFLEALHHTGDDITHYILRQIEQNQPEVFQQLPDNLISQLRKGFKDKYRFSYNDRALKLRYVETWGNAEADMVQHHADALLSYSSIDEREQYLSGLQEKISVFRCPGVQEGSYPENLLQQTLDFSAAYKAEQYVSVFRETLLKKNRSWFSRNNPQFLNIFQAQLYRAIDASLVIANCQRELPQTDQFQMMTADTASEAEVSGTFRQELFSHKGELAEQFTSVLMNVIMRTKYNLPNLADSPVQISQSPPETSNPDPVTVTEPDAPIVYGLSKMPDTSDSTTLEPDPGSPEPPAVADSTLADIAVMVTLPNGFTRQYRLTDNTSLFPVQKLATSLAAFETNSELVESMKKPEGIKNLHATTNQSGGRYHYYRFIFVDKGWGAEIGRASIDVWQAASTTDNPQAINLWVDFSKTSIGGALLAMQAEALRRLRGQPFEPKTYVYTSPTNDQGLIKNLLLTGSPVSNLGQVMILQNTPLSEVSKYLQDSPLHGRNKLTDDELIHLALQLAEGMKALADRQLYLKRLDVATIGIQPETLVPYVADPLVLRLENPGDFEQAALANLQQSDNQQEDQETGTKMPGAEIIYWLGQMFTLLSGRAPIFYQKKIIARLRLLTVEELNILEAFKDGQLKDTVTDALGRERVQPNRLGRYPDVSRERAAEVNLLLLARSMLREAPAKRPSLSRVIDDLKRVVTQPPEE